MKVGGGLFAASLKASLFKGKTLWRMVGPAVEDFGSRPGEGRWGAWKNFFLE